MQGIKVPVSDKFCNYFRLVQSEADKFGGVFFAADIDQDADYTYEAPDMTAHYLDGWLIPKAKSNLFEFLWINSRTSEINHMPEWVKYYRSVEWKLDDNQLKIEFWDYGPFENSSKKQTYTLDGSFEQQMESIRKFFNLKPNQPLCDIGHKQSRNVE